MLQRASQLPMDVNTSNLNPSEKRGKPQGAVELSQDLVPHHRASDMASVEHHYRPHVMMCQLGLEHFLELSPSG